MKDNEERIRLTNINTAIDLVKPRNLEKVFHLTRTFSQLAIKHSGMSSAN